jgi:twitching motility protein PilT
VLSSKDAFRIFRAAEWPSTEELQSFVETAPQVLDAALLGKMLGVLLEDGLRRDAAAHHRRLSAFTAIAGSFRDPQLFVPYAKALGPADPQLRAALVSLLPLVNSMPAHGELCLLLGHTSHAVREAAAEVLGKVGGKSAFDRLTELAREPSFAGRIDAMNIMVPKAQHQSAPLIDAVLRVGSLEEKDHALHLIADPRYFGKDVSLAIELAVRALADQEIHVVALGIAVIAQLASEEVFFVHAAPLLSSGSVPRVRAVLACVGRYSSPRALAVLERAFRQHSSALRLAVLDAIEKMGSDRCLPLLVEALHAKEPVITAKAVEVLGRLSDAGRVDPARAILWLLRSRDLNVRRIAIEVINRVGDKRGELAPKLLRYLRDEDWWIRERTMDALAEMAGQTLTRHLVEYLSDPSDVVRRYAVGALRRLKDPRSIGALLEVAANDADWWVREEAVATIGLIGRPESAPMLLELLLAHRGLEVVCIDALLAVGATHIAPTLAALLAQDDADVQLAVVRALGKLDAREHASDLELCLSANTAPRVRGAAAELLEAWQIIRDTATVNESGSLDELLTEVVEGDADDLILIAGREPRVKRGGRVEVISGSPAIKDTRLKKMLYTLLTAAQRREVEAGRDVDLSYAVKTSGARFRVNVFVQSTGLGAVFRSVRDNPLLLVLENLGLPPIVSTFSEYKNGLVLIGGPTGCGKSTTLAAIIDRINRTSARHIVSIEDPVEVLHQRDQSLITQREVGSHTPSFSAALRATLRQDPDVILVGELRDLDTIAFAVTAAETGHLVFGTVHTASVDTSIDRLISSFPAPRQPQVRTMLADTLRAASCQNLLRRAGGTGRTLAVEVMIANDAISNLIRKGKAFQIPAVITTSREQGMQLMDHELARLVRDGTVTAEEAFARAGDKRMFEALVSGAPAAAPSQPGAGLAGSLHPPSMTPPLRSRPPAGA